MRLFRIGEYAMFLADQGRDAIIIKRIVMLEHFPAIGPPSSIGQVYLGPFFYYLMAPFLIPFRLHPAGLAFGEAIISIAGIVFSYLIVSKILGEKTALIFLVLISFSSELVRSARFAWNPNPLPYFSFITFYFLHKTVTENKWHFALLSGVFFALCFQLHHLAAFMAAPISIMFLVASIRGKKVAPTLINILILLGGFLLTSSPLIIFDLKHDFLNIKNLYSLFTRQNLVAGGSPWDRLLETNRAFVSYITQMQIPGLFALLFMLGIMVFTFYLALKHRNACGFISAHLLNLILYINLFSLLSSSRYPHYYGAVYLSGFVLISFLLTGLFSKKGIIFLYAILVLFLIINAKEYDFIAGKPQYQMRHAQRVALSIIPHLENKPFNFATYPIEFTSEESYLYFLEISGYKAANRAAHEVTGQMIVLCDRGECDILHTKSWNIDMFGKAKIDKIWETEGIKMYRLVHDKKI